MSKRRKLNAPACDEETFDAENVGEDKPAAKEQKIIFRKLNFIGVVSGEKFILHIPPNYRESPSNLTVNHLKQVLESVFQLPVTAQIVGWNGFILNNNDERLEAIGVKNDDSFVVAVDEEILKGCLLTPSLMKRRNPLFGASSGLGQHAFFSDGSDEEAVAARARELLQQSRANDLSNQISGMKRMQSMRRAGSGAVFHICPTTLENLVEMGFNRNAGIRALIMHRNKLELALDWLTEHAGDTTINDPIQAEDYQAST